MQGYMNRDVTVHRDAKSTQGGVGMKALSLTISVAVLICLSLSCQDKAMMAELEAFRAQAKIEEQNEALRLRFMEELNKGNVGIVDELCAPDYSYFSPSGTSGVRTREEHAAMIQAVAKGFPDATRRIEELYTSGDRVISRITFTATHEGEFWGIPATGNRIEFSDISIFRIRDGKIVELRDELDGLDLMTQLGRELKPIELPKAD